MPEPILAIKELKVSFRAEPQNVMAVRGVSLELYSGETLAVVGESGSGKSVTFKAVMGIMPQSAVVEGGEVLYGDKELLKMSERELSRLRGNRIAMIFQDPMSSLDPIVRVGRQIVETVMLTRRSGKRVSRAEAKEIALTLLERVGITDPERRFRQYPFELSGGMRQRVVIAIALAADPEVLICDEPTTALDVTVQAQILELIDELKRERGLSVVFITHDLGVVANIADRVAVMYAGKIVETGTVNEVFYSPAHPYTRALLACVPDIDEDTEPTAIPGTVPDMRYPPKGDAFAPRNPYALLIDFEKEPPSFRISDTHTAATWLLHPDAPKVEMPEVIKRRAKIMREKTDGKCE